MDPSYDSSVGLRVLTVAMHLLSVSILSFCLARRSFFRIGPTQIHPAMQGTQISMSRGLESPGVDQRRPSTGTVETLRKPIGLIRRIRRHITISNYTFHTTCSRFITFLTLITSLLFAICSSIVVSGVGLNSKPVISLTQDDVKGEVEHTRGPGLGCQAIIYLCIFFYGLTKVCVYFVLLERVYIVSCSGIAIPRFSTKTYKVGIMGIFVYIGIGVLLMFSRTLGVNPTTTPLADYLPSSPLDSGNSIPGTMTVDVCIIGLRLYGAIPVILYETFLTIVLTAMFVIPIASSGGHGHKRPLWRWPSLLFTRNLRPFTNSSITRPHSRAFGIPVPNFTPPTPEVRTSVPVGGATPNTTTTGTASLFDPHFNFGSPISLAPTHSSWTFELEDQGMSTTELQRLAIRSLLASFAGLIVSFANISVLASRNGQEEGSTCMRWCLADVVINALAVFAVMQKGDEWLWRSAGGNSGGVFNGKPEETLLRRIWGEADPASTDSRRFTGGDAGGGDGGDLINKRDTWRSVGQESIVFLEDYAIANGPPTAAAVTARRPPKRGKTVSLLWPDLVYPHIHDKSRLAHCGRAVSLQLELRRPSGIPQVNFASPACNGGSIDSLVEYGAKGNGGGHWRNASPDVGASSFSYAQHQRQSQHQAPAFMIPLPSGVALPPVLKLSSDRRIPPWEVHHAPNELRFNETNQFLDTQWKKRRWSTVEIPQRLPGP